MEITAKVNGQVVQSREKQIKDERDSITQLKNKMLTMENQIDIPVTHHFAEGLYCREITIPAGATIVGKIHATQHLNNVLTGSCYVVTAGKETEFIQAPHTFVTGAGVQKVIHAVEDVVFQTYHVTEETDVDKLVDDLTVNDYNELEFDSLLENKL